MHLLATLLRFLSIPNRRTRLDTLGILVHCVIYSTLQLVRLKKKRWNDVVFRYSLTGFQARSKDQEVLEEGGGAGPSTLPRRDHE